MLLMLVGAFRVPLLNTGECICWLSFWGYKEYIPYFNMIREDLIKTSFRQAKISAVARQLFCQEKPKPQTRKPQPSTLNPQPSTLNPQPPTPNPQPSTLNPQPSTLNPKP